MDIRPDQVVAKLGDIQFGGVDEFGCDWALETFDGWGSPASSLQLTQKPRSAGAWGGTAFSAARTMALSGRIYAPDAASLSLALDRLSAQVAFGPVNLTVSEAGRQRWCMVRRSGEVLTNWLMPTVASWSIQVVATDPRKFGDTLMGSTGLPSTTGGLTVPFTVPFDIPAVTVSGQVSLVNAGNTQGPVTLRVDGPCTGPIISHVSSGAQLVFSSSLVLGAGEWLDIDLEAHAVLANGQASRSGWVTSRGWFGFDPGNNTFSFAASAPDPAALLTVSAVSAWQ